MKKYLYSALALVVFVVALVTILVHGHVAAPAVVSASNGTGNLPGAVISPQTTITAQQLQ